MQMVKQSMIAYKRFGAVLDKLRTNPPSEIAGYKVTQIDDLSKPKNELPPTDGLRIWLGDIRIIVRPSGTEPKMKCYIEVISESEAEAVAILNKLRAPLRELLQ
jgi:phosphomannomutase